MKKTTRFLSIVLAVIMAALVCCSCGKVKTTPEKKIQTAIENAQAAKKGEVNVKTVTNTVIGEESENIPMEFTMQYDLTDDKNPLYAIDMTFTNNGNDRNIKGYFKDGYSYTSNNGENTKSLMREDEMISEATAVKILDLAKVAIDIAEITENDDGSFSVKMNVDGEQHKEDIIATLNDIEEFLEGTDITTDDSVINMEIDKDGNITKAKMSLGVSMVTEEGNVYVTCTIEIDYAIIADDFAVEFPDDLDTYIIPQTTPVDTVIA